MNETVAAFGALLAGIGALSWAFSHAWRVVSGERSQNRAASAASAQVAMAGAYAQAAKILVDELQEEVASARSDAKAARTETARVRTVAASALEEVELLRRNINTLRVISDRTIAQLQAENMALRAGLPPPPPPPALP